MAHKKKHQDGPTIIKKYTNRRLYNTATSSYVTQEHLAQMVKNGEDFIVKNAKSGEDITRGVLAQIIFDRESKDSEEQTMLPTSFLRQLIGFYGDGLQTIIPNYLQASMEAFMQNRGAISKELHGNQAQPLKIIEDLTRQNMAIFGEAMKMFAQVTPTTTDTAPSEEIPEPIKKTVPETVVSDPIESLQKQIAAIQRQVANLSKK